MQNMVIATWTLGIGSCWIGVCNEEKVKELLRIPDKWKFVALLNASILIVISKTLFTIKN